MATFQSNGHSTVHFKQTFHKVYPKLGLLLLVLFLIALRAPFLLTQPRVWAEEGVYLNFALHHSVLQTLLHLHLDSGYYVFSADFPAVVEAWVSKKFGLEFAPFVTTYFSLCLQVLPLALLIYGRSRLFRDWQDKFAGCLLILLAPTTSGEIWLNTINSISWAGLTALVILFEDTSGNPGRSRSWLRVVLLFCGISGPYAAITFPLFFFAYWVYREREKLSQAFTLLGCYLLQLSVFIHVRHAGGAASRLSSFSIDSAIVNIFYFHVTNAIGGERGANAIFDHFGLTDSLQKSIAVPRGGPVLLGASFCALVLLLVLIYLWDKRLQSPKTLLIGTFLLFTSVTAFASARGIPHNRYAFLPGLSFLLLVWCNARENRYNLVRAICYVMLACALWSGARDYQKFWLEYRSFCSPWAEEVRRWRIDHTYQLHVWPEGFRAFVEWNPTARSTSHK